MSDEECIDDVMRYVLCRIYISCRIYGGHRAYLFSWLSRLQGAFWAYFLDDLLCLVQLHSSLPPTHHCTELDEMATVVVK